MTVFQILILLFVAFVLYKAIRRLIKKELSVWLFILWFAVWAVVAVIDIFPVVIERLATFVGVGRGVDLVIYITLIVLLYLIFRMNVRLTKTERKMSELVRKIAIDKAKKKVD